MAHSGAADVLGRVRQEREVPRALDGGGEGSLVLGTGTGLAASFDAGAVRNKPAKEADVLVVDDLDVIGAHDTDAAPAAEAARLAIVSGRGGTAAV